VVEGLGAPEGISDLYLARGEEVSILRPIMTGDIFVGIEIPGVESVSIPEVEEVDGDKQKLAMIVSHPCSMREGCKLRPKLQVIRVVKTAKVIELKGWKNNFDRLPLPNLHGSELNDYAVDPSDFYMALYDYRGRVNSGDLKLRGRVACLTEEGVSLLHQRMGHYDTRYPARLSDLTAACAPPFAEAELEQEWNEAFVETLSLSEDEQDEALAREGEEFERLLSDIRPIPSADGRKTVDRRLRDDLATANRSLNARRIFKKLLKARKEELTLARLSAELTAESEQSTHEDAGPHTGSSEQSVPN